MIIKERVSNDQLNVDNDLKEEWLEITNLTKIYGDFVAIEDVNLSIQQGEFLTLLGGSGSGKTTTLLSVAGFLEPSNGEILLSGESVLDKPPHKRNIGMVFQQYSLFPHMTIYENVAFPLKMRKMPKAKIKEMVDNILRLVELEEFAERKPSQLSGGQQQRVALARALVFEPTILLMDEPLAALDKKLRESMQMEIRHLHEKLGLTIIYVTHDQEEALKMSDRIAIFKKGHIQQIGTPSDLYDRPKTQYVAEFFGDSNIFQGEVVSKEDGYVTLIDGFNNRMMGLANQEFNEKDNAVVMVRPEKMIMAKEKPHNDTMNYLSAEIEEFVYLGESYKYMVKVHTGDNVLVKRQIINVDKKNFEIGDAVYISWEAENANILPADNG